jgi:hypothetical protein
MQPMPRKDIIKWAVEWMLANDQAITEELAFRFEREAREEWGGQRIEYIAKRSPRLSEEGRVAAFQAGASSKPTHEVLNEHGISRRTLYRLLKRGPRPDEPV